MSLEQDMKRDAVQHAQAILLLSRSSVEKVDADATYIVPSRSDPTRRYPVVVENCGLAAKCGCEAGSRGQVCCHALVAFQLYKDENHG